MKTYRVYVPTKIYVYIKVEAKDREDAVRVAEEAYKNGDGDFKYDIDVYDCTLDFTEADAEVA